MTDGRGGGSAGCSEHFRGSGARRAAVAEASPLGVLAHDRLSPEMCAIRRHRLALPSLSRPTPHPSPADVVNIEKSGDVFRLLYDTKGRFVLHPISATESTFKLCRVERDGMSAKNIPYLGTHDGRTIRYPDPLIKRMDTVKVDLATGKIIDFIKFEIGNTVMVTKGGNTGRIGTFVQRDAHPGSFDIVHIKDAEGNKFATRLSNIFVIGKGGDAAAAAVSLPRGKGVKRTIFEERDGKGRKE